jgi:serine/threonine protein kinase
MEKVMNEKIIMNYEVVELLHKSSSWGNIVFKVKPQNKEKLYVLKCFPKIENGLQKLIFKREIEALRTLNVCEGIVKLRDSSTELYPFKENECYGGILMDYVPGETLDHINWNKYTQLKKYEICLQILKAVNNAHSNNVIHRDLKPSNIIYDKYADKVTLIDFGTSKIKTVMDSETTMPLYSEGYSAPELILGKNITEKCDYYSIGIIMSEILLSQKNGSDINSRIEEWTGRKEIKDILLSLVQEKPENRPESLENVIVILERLIGNLNTSSCSYSIAIDSRKLVQLKRNSIVEENMTMVQFTNSFLKNEFKQSYGYYDVKDQQYVITGEKMIMKCGYDENEQKMYVTYVGKITADRRNINIKRKMTDSPKILIVSQSHTAVDNILEGLGKAIDNPLEIIRIGAERNISEEIATKYTIAAHREQLVSEIKNNVQQYVEQKNDLMNTITDKNEVKKWEEVKKIQEDWINRLVDQNSLDYQMIRSAVVIAGTCVGFLSNEVIKDMSFDYVIIDEAAKATTPELLVSIIKAKKIILVGDQNQLPAYADAEVFYWISEGEGTS